MTQGGALSLTYADLRKEIAWYLALGRDPLLWDPPEIELIDSVLAAGLRQFFYPPTDKGYEWTFLTPTDSLTLSTAVPYVDLDGSFGSIIGDIAFDPSEELGTVIKEIGPMQMRKLEQKEIANNAPIYFCIEVLRLEDEGQEDNVDQETIRKRIRFWPQPDKEYVVWYRWVREPSGAARLNTDNQGNEFLQQFHDDDYPVGGPAHAETILASCLAVAESRVNDGGTGEKAREFQKTMAASLAYDKRIDVPQSLGYCGDRSDRIASGRWGRDRSNIQVTRNGLLIEDPAADWNNR